MPNTNWTDASTPANAAWEPPTEFFDATTYDDSTVSYDSSTVFYNGYDPSAATQEDVEFDSWTNAGTPATANWTDAT